MAQKDKTKWDLKYTNTPDLLKKRKVSQKLIDLLTFVKGTQVLDVACGAGRNSMFLAQKNFTVEAIDISRVALCVLDNAGYENISTSLVDLDEYNPLKDSYDLIVMTNFLDRKLIKKLLKALQINGILFIETYMHDISNTKENTNPDFLLQKDELKMFVSDAYELLSYDEFDNEVDELYKMKKQSIVLRRVI